MPSKLTQDALDAIAKRNETRPWVIDAFGEMNENAQRQTVADIDALLVHAEALEAEIAALRDELAALDVDDELPSDT